MVRRLGLGKNNHLTDASLALNPRILSFSVQTGKSEQNVASGQVSDISKCSDLFKF